MLAGMYRMSAASESAAVSSRLPRGLSTSTEPQRMHSAAVPGCTGAMRCTRPQVSQAMTSSVAISGNCCCKFRALGLEDLGDRFRHQEHRVMPALQLVESPQGVVAVLVRKLVERAGRRRGAIDEGLR